jgi:hypothetical protein
MFDRPLAVETAHPQFVHAVSARQPVSLCHCTLESFGNVRLSQRL